MTSFPWRSVINSCCANCNVTFDLNTGRTTKINTKIKTINVSSLATEVQILDAFLHIYGLSPEDFADIFPEYPDESRKYFTDIGGEDISLCYKCLQVFIEVCDVFEKFDNLSHEDSLLKRVLKFKTTPHSKPTVKTELENNTENVNESDDLFQTWNSDNDHSDQLSDPEEQEKVVAKLENPSLTSEYNQHHPREKRRSRKKNGGKGKIKHKTEVSNFAIKCESNPLESENTAGPFVRLTRLSVNGAKPKNKKLPNYEEEDEDSQSSDSEFEIKPAKKRKPYKKRTSWKISPVNIKNEGETSADVGTEDVDLSLNGRTATQNNFVKTRPENGKRLVYTCNICGESARTVKRYIVHLNSHKKEANKKKRAVRKRVKCPQCDKMCKNAESLKIHEKKQHSGDTVNQCDICGKTFVQLETLTRHQQCFHSQEKQFECKTCGLKYKWKGSLQSHELTHKNPRPHVCEKCGMSYTNKSNLNQHKTYHEDEERDKELFRCQECGKGLKNRKSLRKHVNTFHRADRERIFSCPICGKTTKHRYNLKVHMKLHEPQSQSINESQSGPAPGNSLNLDPIPTGISDIFQNSQLQQQETIQNFETNS